MNNPTVQRNFRPLRFSLRSLLILIAVIAAGAGVAGRRMAEVRTERSVAAEIQRLGGYVRFEERAPGPNWLVRLLGEDFYCDLYLVESDSPRVDDETLGHLAKVQRLEWLVLDSDRITDRGMGQIARLGQLRRLELGSRRITDDGLAALEGLSHLRWLALHRTQVTRRGVERLRLALPDCVVQWGPPDVPTAPSSSPGEKLPDSDRLARN